MSSTDKHIEVSRTDKHLKVYAREKIEEGRSRGLRWKEKDKEKVTTIILIVS